MPSLESDGKQDSMEANPRIVAPSILASDYGNFASEARRARDVGGGDWLHVDIMDGHFVDNISFGPGVVNALRGAVDSFLDVHLMITRPDHYWSRFHEAGADSITVHVEADHEVGATLEAIRKAGCRVGLSLNPATPFAAIEPYLKQIDLLLVMTVVPGFGGQSFMRETLPKIEAAREFRQAHGLTYDIEVDGGIDGDTAVEAAAAGANVLVAGTYIFKAPNMAAAVQSLREA
ncbi:MAG: ribulose-phosphate 3-epimerase [Verrucomicrobiota bacterium]